MNLLAKLFFISFILVVINSFDNPKADQIDNDRNYADLCREECNSLVFIQSPECLNFCQLCSLILPNFMIHIQQTISSSNLIDEDLTEIQLTKQEIDSALSQFSISSDELYSISNFPKEDFDSFSHFTYQALRDSIENLMNNFYHANKIDVNKKINDLRIGIENIRSDFTLKVNYLKINMANLTNENEASINSTVIPLFKKFDYFEEKLNNIVDMMNQIESNFSSIINLVSNYTTLIESFHSRLKTIEGLLFNSTKNKALNNAEESENSTNITNIVKTISQKLIEIESKLEMIYHKNSLILIRTNSTFEIDNLNSSMSNFTPTSSDLFFI